MNNRSIRPPRPGEQYIEDASKYWFYIGAVYMSEYDELAPLSVHFYGDYCNRHIQEEPILSLSECDRPIAEVAYIDLREDRVITGRRLPLSKLLYLMKNAESFL